MKTLYISDMDGTLLNNEARLSERSSRMISELTASGVLISVATARTPATVENILEGTATANELVVMTGATLWNRAEQAFDGMHLLPRADVEMMLAEFAKTDITPFCYALSRSHLEVYHSKAELTESEQKFVGMRRNLRLKTFHLGEACPLQFYDSMVLFFAMGGRDSIVGIAENLRAKCNCYVSYYKDTYTPDLWLLEIFAPGVSKAEGVLELKRKVGADRLVVFGDNLNDIPMLRVADLAVAVDNALPEVKDICNVIIGPNTADAVPTFIAQDSGIAP